MRITWILVAGLAIAAGSLFAQQYRSGIFLHHSTGAAIWGPNGSPTNVPAEISAYNVGHTFNSGAAVSLDEVSWPLNPWDNEWERWHWIFEGRDTSADISSSLSNYPIIVIKSCFPSSGINDIGSPSDTLSPGRKTIFNYKWHWRRLIQVMQQHPSNFFVVWTNAPKVGGSDRAALLSDWFCRWAKDTLSQGLDNDHAIFPKNIYVFDFFHKLAGPDGKLKRMYSLDSVDSHPNAAATALVAPQFVREVFDAALAYEKLVSVHENMESPPQRYSLGQNYPNPFNPTTMIAYHLPWAGNVRLAVYDLLGREIRTLINRKQEAGSYEFPFEGESLPSGMYLYTLTAGSFAQTRKMVLLK